MHRILLLPSPLLPRLSAERFENALAARWWRLNRNTAAVGISAFPRPAPDAQAVLDTFEMVVAMEHPDLVLTHSNPLAARLGEGWVRSAPGRAGTTRA